MLRLLKYIFILPIIIFYYFLYFFYEFLVLILTHLLNILKKVNIKLPNVRFKNHSYHSRKNEDTFDNDIFDYTKCLNKEEENAIKHFKHISIHVPKRSDLSYFVIEEYFFEEADKIEIFKNFFEDDKNIQYILYFSKEKRDCIFFIDRWYYYNNDIFIYNKRLKDIIEILEDRTIMNRYTLQEDKNEINNIILKLEDKFLLKDKMLSKYLYLNYYREIEINKAIIKCFFDKYYTTNDIYDSFDYREQLLCDMLNVKKSQLKKVNETILYKFIKDIYPDTVLQYRNKFLKNQSLDIYIPSKKIAVEYNGEQHYKSIEYFGGVEKFIKQKELDKQKQKICSENGIKLIIWKYDEPLTEDEVIKRIK